MWKNAIRLRHAHSTQSFSCESENVNKERDGLHWVRVDEKKWYDRRTSSLFVIFYSFYFFGQFLCRCCNELNVYFHFRVHSWAFLVGEMSIVSEHSHLTHNWRGQPPVCAVKGIEYCRMRRFAVLHETFFGIYLALRCVITTARFFPFEWTVHIKGRLHFANFIT